MAVFENELYSVEEDVQGNYVATFKDGVTTIPSKVFKDLKCNDKKISVIIPDSVTSIGERAFQGCASLESISFPKVISIGKSAFEGCASLKSVFFPKVTSIGVWAFEGCASLKSISFPKVTSIGGWAFEGCASLKSVSFPEVTSIGKRAFYDCTSLESIFYLKAPLRGEFAFSGCSKFNLYNIDLYPLIQFCLNKAEKANFLVINILSLSSGRCKYRL